MKNAILCKKEDKIYTISIRNTPQFPILNNLDKWTENGPKQHEMMI